jgi:hypothetical protein
MTIASSLAPSGTKPINAVEFIKRWHGVEASELSTAQSYVRELCDVLDLNVPHPTAEKDYMFERPVTFRHGDGTDSPGRIDCYRRGAFVLEAKKLFKAPGKGFDDAMLRARAQAEAYARALPATEGRPPFLLVVDVGNVIEVYAEFSRSGATYTPFPDSASHRISLAELTNPDIQARLRAIWLEPLALDPTRTSAKVTRHIAIRLADVARTLEAAGHSSQAVAGFLTRCLFTMFAEDVGLLPRTSDNQGVFVDMLKRFRDDPATLGHMLHALWRDMDRGGFSAVLTKEVLRFNGKLFKKPDVLPLQKAQVDLLLEAAQANWTEVEPAIFGTLLERALNPIERHSLGAHYTPRAYVERLVLPTVIEPLRADWADAQAAALLLANEAGELEGKKRETRLEAARDEVRRFHHALTQVRVLDPACGSGNFLYVTLEHMKRLEGEVIDLLAALGDSQQRLDAEGLTVDPHQFLGIELNPRAAAVAELVLWIGYLQWHFRTRGNARPPQPVLKDFANIECRDGVLTYERAEVASDADGKPITRWDGITFKTHPVTGEQVPDEALQVTQWNYINPSKTEWPQADFIIGNPPFIGAAPMRAALGDGYVEALRRVWVEVPNSADFVMYWWEKAAEQVRAGKTRRFGLITTNSLRQTFNRRVVEQHLSASPSLSLLLAIPDHPWVDNGDGAAVRIAMTVGTAGVFPGKLLKVVNEEYVVGDDAAQLMLDESKGNIHADLTIGANVSAAGSLQAMQGISSPGVKLHGAGFIVTPNEACTLGLGSLAALEKHIRPYRNGRDLTDAPRGVFVIDLFGLSAEDVRDNYPAVYQWLLERVKPERDQNNRATYRDNWWIFGEPRRDLRLAISDLSRYIVTVETAKHRTFQFLDASILPDNMLVTIATDDAFHLGVLSSTVHVTWALAAGGRLGVGNDPRYNKTRCFETFPFPSDQGNLTPELRARIAVLAERLDAHRKRQQVAHPDLKLTGMYNMLEKLRAGEALTAKDKTIHEQGLVSVLKILHDELDVAVLAAYGWSDLTASAGEPEAMRAKLLQRLADLNAERAIEEAKGTVRWLRPAYQNPTAVQSTALAGQKQQSMALGDDDLQPALTSGRGTQNAVVWPKALPDQVRAVSTALISAPLGLPLSALTTHFKGKGQWKKDLLPILETLAALGRARSNGNVWYQS